MNSKKIAVICLGMAMLFSFVVIIFELPTPVKVKTIWVDDSFLYEDSTHKTEIQAGSLRL